MSSAWIVVPLLEIVAVIVFIIVVVVLVVNYILASQFLSGVSPPTNLLQSPEFVAVTRIFSFVIFILSLAFAYMLYKLIKRRNTHLARQLFLYEDLTAMTKEMAAKKGLDVSLSLNNLERTVREARSLETEKNAVLWVILTLAATTAALGGGFSSGGPLLPTLATLYVYYFLMRDFFNHERREDIFLEELNRTLMALGVTANLPRRASTIPSRSFILYIVLTVVTLGFFWAYWVYTFINDPNSHFRHQALTEDTILAQVTPIMA